ncbi:hypothetical protein ACOJCM_04615 [Billgrantia sp. LNSP4103-1]|uniref:hypothetical protein n=1 Tax=Billgrantia sp. LNSP4103-1 TaxID=3410266 RepID=UPI00403FAC56
MMLHDTPLRRLPIASWGLAVLLMTLLVVALGQGYRLLQEHSDAPLLRVVVNGETLTLEGETHAALGQELEVLAGRLDLRLRDEMQPWLDARLQTAFAPLETAIPDYLDWYFSLRGSYLRLAMALGGDLETWTEAQLHERLVERSGVLTALDDLQTDFDQRIQHVQQRYVEEISHTLHARYADRQVADSATEPPMLDLDLVLEQALRGRWDEARWGTAGAAGVVGFAAGRAFAQRLAAGAAMQGSRMLAGRIVVRLGGHAARSVGTGAATASATAPTGPAALLAGAGATALALAGFAGTEYALLKAEESRYRDEMQAELELEAERARAEARQALEAAMSRRAEALAAQLQEAGQRAEATAEVPEAYRIFDS